MNDQTGSEDCSNTRIVFTRKQNRIISNAVTLLAMSVLFVIVCLGVYFLFKFISAHSSVLLPPIVAIICAKVVQPAYDSLRKFFWRLIGKDMLRLDTHRSFMGGESETRPERAARITANALAIFVLGVAVFVPLGMFFWFFGKIVVEQILALINAIPAATQWVARTVTVKMPQVVAFINERGLMPAVAKLSPENWFDLGAVTAKLSGSAFSIWGWIKGLLGSFMGWIALPVYTAIYLASRPLEGGDFSKLLVGMSEKTRNNVKFLIDEFIRIVVVFFRGQVLVALIQGILFGLGFQLIAGLDYGMVIGLLLGLCNIVPYLGNIIGLPVVGALALFGADGGSSKFGVVLLIFLGVQMADGYFITPKIIGSRTGLNSFVVIFSLFFWSSVIGVYVGRPFEGWDKKYIEQRLGTIRGYVHDRLNVPLVVTDDDISGTCTFIRALEDSGRYAETPEAFFGETWLNYMFERQCILWWGGKGISTEHTAFLNLKNGIPSPESGSAARNSRIVAEQIGAQIFIDAFGMVAPGNPALAVALAEKAARVSHDGEAVYAAQVVAALVSLGFVERDIDRLLDEAVAFIPRDSLIAQIHRDVRAWAAADGDWRRTYDRIAAKYGYPLYGGGCHVVPNHAIMVMAWACSGNNFHRAMSIIATAGWDTDCNAANVGSVMGLVAGLDGIVADYDYRTPFADRVQIPTAEGTDSASDVLRIAGKIAAMGRRIMDEAPLPQPKAGAWHHFEMDGALHGYQADDFSFEMRGNATVSNRAFPTPSGSRHALEIAFRTGSSSFARVLTPTMIFNPGGSAYANLSTPHLYNGMTVRVQGAVRSLTTPASLRLVAFTSDDFGSRASASLASDWTPLAADKPFVASWDIRGCESAAIVSFGFEFASASVCQGVVDVDSVSYDGNASVFHEVAIPHRSPDNYTGWIANLDSVFGPLPNFPEPAERICKNQGLGFLVTGNRYWSDVSVQAKFSSLLADAAGLVLRYQGTRRFYAVVLAGRTLQIRRYCHGMTVLAETAYETAPGQFLAMKAEAAGDRIAVSIDGVERLSAQDGALANGGAGYCVESGVCAFRETRVVAKTRSGL